MRNLVPDIHDPTVNPLFRDVLAHYGVVALPCRIKDPDRKGKGAHPRDESQCDAFPNGRNNPIARNRLPGPVRELFQSLGSNLAMVCNTSLIGGCVAKNKSALTL
jgi:hypothetical protein